MADPENSPALVKLAKRIFSIVPNSASCERLFSSFGNILTKLRNRLGTETLVSLAELRLHLRDEHLRLGVVQNRLKRHFEAKDIIDEISTAQAPSSLSNPGQQTDDINIDPMMAVTMAGYMLKARAHNLACSL